MRFSQRRGPLCLSLAFALVVIVPVAAANAQLCVTSLGTAVTQDSDRLAPGGTSSVVPIRFHFPVTAN